MIGMLWHDLMGALPALALLKHCGSSSSERGPLHLLWQCLTLLSAGRCPGFVFASLIGARGLYLHACMLVMFH